MASITKRGDKWRAEVRRKGYDAQCKTLATKAQAQAWARGVEAAIDAGEAPSAPKVSKDTTVGDAIRAYRALRGDARPIKEDSTEHYQLKTLERILGSEPVASLTVERLTAFCVQRRDEDLCSPYTINLDLGKLGTVLRYAGPLLKVIFPDVVGAARPTLTHLRLIGGGERRSRRPVEDELTRLLDWLRENKGPLYAEAVAFAALTAMRRGEVVVLRVQDVDPRTHLATVARKHPRKGKTIEQVPILGDAWTLLQRQTPSEDGRYFPLHPQTLTKYFGEARDALGIPNLRLHDMRHEGTSKLFEQGLQIPQVALVTGHKDWKNLQRYTNLNPEDLTKRELDKRPGDPPDPGSPRSDVPHQDRS